MKSKIKINSKFDLAVVIGTRFEDSWKIRQDLIDRLDKTYDLYRQGTIKKIIVSGKWTIWYDWLGIIPPTTEAHMMKEYLVQKGINPKDIVKESRSKDTIGNIYYLKLFLKVKPEYKSLLIICATQRAKRIKFLVNKILGNNFTVNYYQVDAPNDKSDRLGSENKLINIQESFLANVQNGDEYSLRHLLYKSSYYRDQARAVATGQRKNELLN